RNAGRRCAVVHSRRAKVANLSGLLFQFLFGFPRYAKTPFCTSRRMRLRIRRPKKPLKPSELLLLTVTNQKPFREMGRKQAREVRGQSRSSGSHKASLTPRRSLPHFPG